MPAELAVNKFLMLLERSGIVAGNHLQKLMEEFGEEDSPHDSSQKIANELVSREVLTQWQANMLLQGKHRGFILGSYRILRPLGRGGMGAVYLAEHQVMRRRCAIKVLPSNYDRESSVLDRFHREAQAVAALDHPNIVRAYDVASCVQNKSEIHYLVMEYIDGQDLQKMVEEQGILGYRQGAEYVRQAAEGLAHAHDAGFVHRDIKPANLLVDTSGVVKILDLGLARIFDDAADGSLTRELGETVLGTADYLAPEQALDSHDVDARADIYSLGQTFYFLLKGQPPFPEGTVAQRLMAHQIKTPEPITKTRPDAPLSLVAIIEKMTVKKREQRFQTARDVAEALKAWLEGHEEDSGFLRRASRLVTRSTPPVTSSADPTHPKASAMDETDLGFAPLEEEEAKAPSGSRLDRAAGESGVKTAETEQAAEKEAQKSADAQIAAPGVEAESPPEVSPQLPVDLEDFEPLEAPSVEAALDGALPSPLETKLSPAPLSGSGAMKSVSTSGPKAKIKGKAAAAEPKGLFARMLESPLFWVGAAALAVIVLVVAFAIIASRPKDEVSMGQAAPSPGAPPSQPSPSPEDPVETETAEPGPKETEPEPIEPGQAEPAPVSPEPGDGTSPPAGAQAETPRGPTEVPDRPAGPGETPTTPQPPTPQPVTPEPSVRPSSSQPGEGPGTPQPPKPRTPAPEEQPKPETPKAKPDTKALLAGIDRLAAKFEVAEAKQKQLKLPPPMVLLIGSMTRYELEQALDRIQVSPAENAPSLLQLKLELKEDRGYAVYVMSGEIKHRLSDSQEVTIWEHQQEIGRFRGTPNQTLLRAKVKDFFDELTLAYRKASAKR
jgi:serine/threonine-protein kinase